MRLNCVFIVDYVRRTFFSWRMFSSELENMGLDKKLRQPGYREVQPRSYLTSFEIFLLAVFPSLSSIIISSYILDYQSTANFFVRIGHFYDEPETRRRKNAARPQRDFLIKSAALSAMAYTAACVCPAGTYGYKSNKISKTSVKISSTHQNRCINNPHSHRLLEFQIRIHDSPVRIAGRHTRRTNRMIRRARCIPYAPLQIGDIR